MAIFRMFNPLLRYSSDLDKLSDQHQKRKLSPIAGVDFTSNDFLAFSCAPQIREAVISALHDDLPLGSGGSRLLRGNHNVHETLENIAAEFFGCEKSLYFASGYVANFAVLTTLPKRHDLIVFDALSHASIREGLFASPVKCTKARHNDVDEIEGVLSNWRNRADASATAWIVVESLYSMDGDRAPLDELFAVADRYGAMLVVDEAHATGVFGERARGLTESYAGRPNLIAVHTCGKALGVSGGLVCAPSAIIDFMINRSRPFIYSTAPPPMNAVAVIAALNLLAKEPMRQHDLHLRIQTAHEEFENQFSMQGSGSQIIPFVIGESESTLLIADRMQKAGYDLRPIRPPTVAPGTSRLRISITLHVSEQEISEMINTLKITLTELGIDPLHQ